MAQVLIYIPLDPITHLVLAPVTDAPRNDLLEDIVAYRKGAPLGEGIEELWDQEASLWQQPYIWPAI